MRNDNNNQSDYGTRNNDNDFSHKPTRDKIDLPGTEPRVFKILLLGGTGTGKSTIINTMTNYFLDGTLDEPKIVIPSKYYKVTEKGIVEILQIFYMDNQAFCTNPEIWKDDESERHTVQFHWDKSIKTIGNLLKEITKLSATSTQAFENMRDFRNKIKSEIVKVTQDIANIQKVQDALDAAQKALQKTGDQKKSFANYTKTESIKLKKIVRVDYHSTVCTLHLTKDIVCHEGCGLSEVTVSGTDHFLSCYCMGSNQLCKECGCGPKSHFHDKVKLVEETKTMNKVLEDMKAQYDNANQQHQKYSSDANNYQSSLANLQAAANAKYEYIHKLCLDLSKICSRFNFVDELHANIESMRQDARTIQNINLRKNAEMEIQRLEKLANDLSLKRGRTFK
ncbi:7569_t:CDS:2 [Ambispora leptoticha]|uniref:7569_t:CDS:1 n=1 Tax=Ambispora leptoticha TaxID=144679 RepID=A0A9N9APU3_9GLOM|nr:7569_t:CDS:2 [Ambispora leptoticha]